MKIKCPYCKRSNLLKQGFRINDKGKKQKYQCLNCKKWFVENDGFKRMRFKKEIIVKAVHQHIDGFSLYKVQYHLWQHEGVKVTRETINRWTKKYSIFLKSNTPSSSAKVKRKIAP